jgi:cephalosporin-C deacetylase
MLEPDRYAAATLGLRFRVRPALRHRPSMPPLHHCLPFDPSHGYDLPGLLAVKPPPEPPDFAAFWCARYRRALAVDPRPEVGPPRHARPGWLLRDLAYRSTDDFHIHGWLIEPDAGTANRGFVLGHGYGGIDRPDFDLPCADAVYLVPCFRGLCRSRRPPISEQPAWHVLHDIHLRDRYILGGCVEDLWTGVSALLRLHPEVAGSIGYMGISFGGGIGALGLAWDGRIGRGHLNVPTFGHQPLRLTLPSVGSAAAVQAFAGRHGHVEETLAYYDAAVAARHIAQPMHVAAAFFDPAVAPPGQFAVYNALPGPKRLLVLTAGHFDHPERAAEERKLLRELTEFFGCHEPRVSPLVQPPSGA